MNRKRSDNDLSRILATVGTAFILVSSSAVSAPRPRPLQKAETTTRTTMTPPLETVPSLSTTPVLVNQGPKTTLSRSLGSRTCVKVAVFAASIKLLSGAVDDPVKIQGPAGFLKSLDDPGSSPCLEFISRIASREPIELTIILPASLRDVSITVLKGSIAGTGAPHPLTTVSLKGDQTSISWERFRGTLLNVALTDGRLEVNGLDGRLSVSARKADGFLQNLNLTSPESQRSSVVIDHGRLQVSNSQGPLSLTSLTADLSLNGVRGPLFAQTGKGKIATQNITGPVELFTETGAIHAQMAQGGRGMSRIRSQTGAIQLFLPNDAAAVAWDGTSPVTTATAFLAGDSNSPQRILAASPQGTLEVKRF